MDGFPAGQVFEFSTVTSTMKLQCGGSFAVAVDAVCRRSEASNTMSRVVNS
jgi:hypothetical protein